MTIECYHGNCKYHGAQEGEEGPFCFEDECKATEEEQTKLDEERRIYLKKQIIHLIK